MEERLFYHNRKVGFFPCNPTVVDLSWGLGHGPQWDEIQKKSVVLRVEGLVTGRIKQIQEETHRS